MIGRRVFLRLGSAAMIAGMLGSHAMGASDPEAWRQLEAGFQTPPHAAKPHTWYHMMNGNVTKEGITRDFEALSCGLRGPGTTDRLTSDIVRGGLGPGIVAEDEL